MSGTLQSAPDPSNQGAAEPERPRPAAFPTLARLAGHRIFLVVLLIVTAFALAGVGTVPFHPDESTYLYMSRDFETLLTGPLSLAWTPEETGTLEQIYRMRDAPLTRYWIGAVRRLVGFAPLPADWDWSQSWEANRTAGALPPERLLNAGRVASALTIPASLVFLYALGRSLGGRWMGLIAALYVGTNALTLLHARRAMSEGVLILGISFFLWSLLHRKRQPWLVGLAAALAVSAKHSAVALAPIGLLAVIWPGGRASDRGISGSLAQFVVVFALTAAALNPLFWRHPIQAARASLDSRQVLLQQQVSDFGAEAPGQILRTPGRRAGALIANLYLLGPSFHEAGNYVEHTARSERDYLRNPGHTLLRGMVAGGALLTLTVFGLALGGMRAARAALRDLTGGGARAASEAASSTAERARALALVLLATGAQAAFLIVFVPLPWQRYVVPLIPMAGLWTGYGLGRLITPNESARSGRTAGADRTSAREVD